MKKTAILFPLFGIFLYIILSGYAAGPSFTLGTEYTGATGTVGCGSPGCHNPTATASTTVTIQLLSGVTPVTSYTPGGSYTIKITGTQTSGSFTLSKFGFQVTCVKTSTTTNAGAMTAPAGCHSTTVSGVNVIEHSSALSPASGSGGSGTTYVVSIPWTAPVAGTGGVTIRSVVNAVNFDGSATSADKWNSATPLVITEASSTVVAPITGTMTVCVGATTTLSDVTPGGTWSSGTPGVATVSSTGLVTGMVPGTTVISYNAGAAGTATATVTVNPTPPAITGTLTVCSGATTPLADAMPGGTWSSTTTTVATIGTSGVATGVTGGTSIIKYTMAGGCFASATLTVNTATPAAIAGSPVVCVAKTITLTDATPGGVWTSLHTAFATVGSATGIVAGVAVGLDTIKYTVTNGCGTGFALFPVSVHAVGTCAAGIAFNTTNSFAPGIKVYPNPNSGTFSVNLLSDMDEQAHFVITNMLGLMVKEFTGPANEPLEIRINAPAGIYYISAFTTRSRYDNKLVIE
jgi:trimeric autotransporter adhesin